MALFIGLFVGLGMYIWGLWQHDILCSPRISDFFTGNFEFFTGIRVSVGLAYNLTLLVQSLGVFIAVAVTFVAVWYWPEEQS